MTAAQTAAAGLLVGHPWAKKGCGGAERDTNVCVSPQSPITGSSSELAWVCFHLPCLSASVSRCWHPVFEHFYLVLPATFTRFIRITEQSGTMVA